MLLLQGDVAPLETSIVSVFFFLCNQDGDKPLRRGSNTFFTLGWRKVLTGASEAGRWTDLQTELEELSKAPKATVPWVPQRTSQRQNHLLLKPSVLWLNFYLRTKASRLSGELQQFLCLSLSLLIWTGPQSCLIHINCITRIWTKWSLVTLGSGGKKECDTLPSSGTTARMIHAATINDTDCSWQKSISGRAPSFLTSAEQTGVYHLPVAKTQTSLVHLCPHSMTFSNSGKSRHIHSYLRTLTWNTARQTREMGPCMSRLSFYKYYCCAPQANIITIIIIKNKQKITITAVQQILMLLLKGGSAAFPTCLPAT